MVATFIGAPELLILDEPFANLDPTTQIRLKELLTEKGKDPNTTILIWRSTGEISRSNGGLVYQGQTVATLIANISSDLESYVHTVPPNTNEEAYYAITYFIPNKTGPGEDFVDLRFLSGNALTQPILEDNRPPAHVSVFSVATTSEDDGTGEPGSSHRPYEQAPLPERPGV